MKSDPEIEQEIRRIRKQGRAQVIILVSTLLLVFLWFTSFSWIFDQQTFGQEAMYSVMGEFFSVQFLIILTFMIASFFTIVYIYILRKFVHSMSD